MLNPSRLKFKIKVFFRFTNIEEAIKVRNLLKNLKYDVSSIMAGASYGHREKRLKFILNNLMARIEPIDMGKFFSICYGANFNTSYATYVRDIAILILQGKIKATHKGNTTLIERESN